MKRTKIVCTLGPASQSVPVLKRLLQAGMNVARFNFSHGTHPHHQMMMKNLRQASRQTKLPVAAIQDLQGPRVRLGLLPKEGVELRDGEKISFAHAAEYSVKQPKTIPIDYPLYKYVKAGYDIFIQDGLISVKVLRVQKKMIYVQVKRGGKVFSHKGINVPSASFAAFAFTAKDKEDAVFGLTQGFDFVALSFVESARDVVAFKRFLQKHAAGKPHPQVIVKMERLAAVKAFKEILAVTDAVMIARGDLGVELPPQQVPIIQKDIIHKCLEAGKPVIVATQMLESMMNNPRPTRAEVSDVANAVIDHTDAVMLSSETASGAFPVETVQVMHDIAVTVEESRYDDLPKDFFGSDGKTLVENVTQSLQAYSGTKNISVQALLVEATSGDLPRMIARQRMKIPTFAFTRDRLVYNQLLLSWGVMPVLLPTGLKQVWATYAFHWLKQHKLIHKGDLLAFVYKRGEVVTKFY